MLTSPAELETLLEKCRHGHSQPSDYALDLLVAGAIDNGEAERLRQSVAQKPNGAERLSARIRTHEEFRQRHDPQQWLSQMRQAAGARESSRFGWSLQVSFAGAVAIAICLTLVLFRPADDSTTRSKGTTRFKVFALRRGAVLQVSPGGQLMPGDELTFAATNERPRYVAVLSFDPAGELFTYFPFAGEEAIAVPAGSDVVLPGAVRLDATLGEESLVFLDCDAPAHLEAARKALGAWFAEQGRAQAPAGVVPGCGVDIWTMTKGR